MSSFETAASGYYIYSKSNPEPSLEMYSFPRFPGESAREQFFRFSYAEFCTFCHGRDHREMACGVVACPSLRTLLSFKMKENLCAMNRRV